MICIHTNVSVFEPDSFIFSPMHLFNQVDWIVWWWMYSGVFCAVNKHFLHQFMGTFLLQHVTRCMMFCGKLLCLDWLSFLLGWSLCWRGFVWILTMSRSWRTARGVHMPRGMSAKPPGSLSQVTISRKTELLDWYRKGSAYNDWLTLLKPSKVSPKQQPWEVLMNLSIISDKQTLSEIAIFLKCLKLNSCFTNVKRCLNHRESQRRTCL